MGFKSYYIQFIEDGPHELEIYNGSLHIYTPFKIFPYLDAHAILEIEENMCKINFTFTSDKTHVTVAGTGEVRVFVILLFI